MNNQAAQKMPELPAPVFFAAPSEGYTADQIHQYARDYAAGLSQTAGVADATKSVCDGCPHLKTEWWRDHLDNDETDSGTSATCTKEGRNITAYWREGNARPNWCPLLAAAPAASGGECPTLHPATEDLICRFSDALRDKLSAAEKKYGYSDGWASPDWMDQCRRHLDQHVAKGDPRDVAAYCALLWHHGEPTTKRDRDADRKRFPDDDFNAWLDAGISDAGHTVYDSLSSIEDAWQGWHGHVLSVRIDENPVFDDLAIDSPTAASVSERAREIDSPIERLRKIRTACGELSAMVGDGPHREHMAIISGQASLAIEQLQREQALTQQRGDGVAPGDGHAWGDFSRKDLCELADRLTEEANLRITRKWPFLKSPGAIANAIDSATQHYPLVGAIRSVLIETDQIYVVPDTTPQPGASTQGLREAIRSLLSRVRAGSEVAPWVRDELESLLTYPTTGADGESLAGRGG
jgi:hypothetical protein